MKITILEKPKTESIVEKRKAIARDVLAQIELEKIIPVQGVYYDYYNNECQVCALGSMLCSLVKPVHNSDAKTLLYKLEEFFPKEELQLIEACFEGGFYGIYGSYIPTTLTYYGVHEQFLFNTHEAIAIIRDRYFNLKSRLKYLMTLILRNPTGNFRIPRSIARNAKV